MKKLTLICTLLPILALSACQTTPPPTEVAEVATEPSSLDGVAFINWNVANEVDLQEFRVFRSDSEDGTYEHLSTMPAQGPGMHGNQSYGFEERDLAVGRVIYYKVERAYVNGETMVLGPVRYEVKREE